MLLKDKVQHLVYGSGETYHAISKKLGIAHTTLYYLMSGKHKDMKLSTAFKLADYFGVDVNVFREDVVDE